MTLDPGEYQVKVSQSGFLEVQPQKAVVRKGASSTLSFVLVAEPKRAVQVTPTVATIPTELTPKVGVLTVRLSPANAELRYARVGGASAQVFRAPSMELEPGKYLLTARAAGYSDLSKTIDVVAGGSSTVPFELAPKVAPQPHLMRAEDWDKTWAGEGEWYTRQGGDFVLYKVTPTAGVFHFVISPKASKGFLGLGGSPKMRLLLDYRDPQNYIECQIDKQSFSSEERRNGKKTEHAKKRPHGVEATSFEFRVTIAPARIAVEIRSGEMFRTVDEWSDSDAGRDFTQGQFGFYLPNQDRIYFARFQFDPQPGVR